MKKYRCTYERYIEGGENWTEESFVFIGANGRLAAMKKAIRRITKNCGKRAAYFRNEKLLEKC